MNNKKEVNAAILIIGNEILSGRTKDLNTSTISSWLNGIGIKVLEVSFKDYNNNKNFYEDKIQTAKFYFKRVLPRVENHFKSATNGIDYIMNFNFN